MKRKPKGPRRAGQAAAARLPSGAPAWLSQRQLAGILILALLALVSFYPALFADFIWDDVIFTAAPRIHALSGLWEIWFSPGGLKNEGHYWPIVYTSFWLEHKLWGMAPFGYHLVNILLHLANVLLLWLLLHRLAVPGAWAVAAVFAVHPLHVESVAWVIERKDLLSGLFYLGALLLWLRFADTRRRGYYLWSLGLFVAALLSKSIVVTLPLAILIVQWYRHGRIERGDVLCLAPFFAVAAGITLADLLFYQSRVVLSLGYSPPERLLIAARALCFYFGKLLWPADLIIIYPLWEIRVQELLGWVYVAAVVLAAALLLLGRRHVGRGPLAGGLFFAVTLAPTLGFIDYGYMQFSLVADRFQYLAGIGVIAVVVGAAAHWAGGLSGGFRTGAQGLFVAVLLLLGALTWRQASLYRDGVTFFSHVVTHNPEARYVYANLASSLLHAGRLEEAVSAGLTALEKIPDMPKAYSARSVSAEKDAARAAFLKAYSEKAYSAYSLKVHINLGLALLELERHDEAERYFRKALEVAPSSADAHQHLGDALGKQGRHAEALVVFREALRLDRDRVAAHVDLGVALLHLQRYEEAIESISKAQALDPDLSPAILHTLSGRALAGLGRYAAAAEHFQRALQADPSAYDTMDRFARMLFEQGEYAKALQLCRDMVELEPDNAAAYANLGITLFYLQRHEEARQSFVRALSIDPDLAMAQAGLEQLRSADIIAQ